MRGKPRTRTLLVRSKVQTKERSHGIRTLNLIAAKLDLGVEELLILLQISQVDLKHAALEVIGDDALALSTVRGRPALVTVAERRGGLYVEPLLTSERIHHVKKKKKKALAQ
jgi:hypothetical protein